jgi:hypothetical protein
MMCRSFLRWWGSCLLIALGLSAIAPVAGGEMLNATEATATLSGRVYADINNNGFLDSFERGIPGVKIVLQGIEELGAIVTLDTVTGRDGRYSFAGLSPGHYSVAEMQPVEFIEGKPRGVGSLGGLAVDSNLFSEIDLKSGTRAHSYDFGEWGLKAAYISKADLLVPEPSVFGAFCGTLVALAAVVRLRRR